MAMVTRAEVITETGTKVVVDGEMIIMTIGRLTLNQRLECQFIGITTVKCLSAIICFYSIKSFCNLLE